MGQEVQEKSFFLEQLYPEYESTTFLQNIKNHLPDAASQPRRSEFPSARLLGLSQIRP
jgi:hypothetical protein